MNQWVKTAQIIASEDLARLEYGEAHIAFRAGAKPEHLDYVVSPFKPVGVNLYAHDSYVQRRGIPRDIGEFAVHDFVVASEETANLPFWPWLTQHVPFSQIAVSSKHIGVLTEAVLAGLGIGFLSDADVAGRFGLHPLLPPNNGWSVPLWVVTHVDLHRTEKVQAMLRKIKDN